MGFVGGFETLAGGGGLFKLAMRGRGAGGEASQAAPGTGGVGRIRFVGGTGPDATRFARIGNTSLLTGGGSIAGFFSRSGAFGAVAPKGFLGKGFAIGLSVDFFDASRTWETRGAFLALARGGDGVSFLPVARGGELGVGCLDEIRGGEADAVGFDMDLGGVLDVGFAVFERGESVDVVFVAESRKGVVGTGFFFSACGGDVVTGFEAVRAGVTCFPFVSVRGGVTGVDFFTGAFEGVLEVVGFFEPVWRGETGTVFVGIALGGEAGGGVVFIVSDCFPRRAVAVATGLAVGGAEAPARVFLTVNRVARTAEALFLVTRPLGGSAASSACSGVSVNN